jgi:small-conductance mechanosensitive channel
MAELPALPLSLPSAETASASVKAALPALTVMAFNGAINLVAACIILAIGWTLSRWIWRWVHDALAHLHYMDETLKPLIANMVSYAVLAVTVVAVLGQFGVQTTSLIAVLGAAGLAVGLACKAHCPTLPPA